MSQTVKLYTQLISAATHKDLKKLEHIINAKNDSMFVSNECSNIREQLEGFALNKGKGDDYTLYTYLTLGRGYGDQSRIDNTNAKKLQKFAKNKHTSLLNAEQIITIINKLSFNQLAVLNEYVYEYPVRAEEIRRALNTLFEKMGGVHLKDIKKILDEEVDVIDEALITKHIQLIKDSEIVKEIKNFSITIDSFKGLYTAEKVTHRLGRLTSELPKPTERELNTYCEQHHLSNNDKNQLNKLINSAWFDKKKEMNQCADLYLMTLKNDFKHIKNQVLNDAIKEINAIVANAKNDIFFKNRDNIEKTKNELLKQINNVTQQDAIMDLELHDLLNGLVNKACKEINELAKKLEGANTCVQQVRKNIESISAAAKNQDLTNKNLKIELHKKIHTLEANVAVALITLKHPNDFLNQVIKNAHDTINRLANQQIVDQAINEINSVVKKAYETELISNNKQKNILLEQIDKIIQKKSVTQAFRALKLLNNPLTETANKASDQINQQVLIQAITKIDRIVDNANGIDLVNNKNRHAVLEQIDQIEQNKSVLESITALRLPVNYLAEKVRKAHKQINTQTQHQEIMDTIEKENQVIFQTENEIKRIAADAVNKKIDLIGNNEFKKNELLSQITHLAQNNSAAPVLKVLSPKNNPIFKAVEAASTQINELANQQTHQQKMMQSVVHQTNEEIEGHIDNAEEFDEEVEDTIKSHQSIHEMTQINNVLETFSVAYTTVQEKGKNIVESVINTATDAYTKDQETGKDFVNDTINTVSDAYNLENEAIRKIQGSCDKEMGNLKILKMQFKSLETKTEDSMEQYVVLQSHLSASLNNLQSLITSDITKDINQENKEQIPKDINTQVKEGEDFKKGLEEKIVTLKQSRKNHLETHLKKKQRMKLVGEQINNALDDLMDHIGIIDRHHSENANQAAQILLRDLMTASESYLECFRRNHSSIQIKQAGNQFKNDIKAAIAKVEPELEKLGLGEHLKNFLKEITNAVISFTNWLTGSKYGFFTLASPPQVIAVNDAREKLENIGHSQ